jgi:hypothetical protein
MRDLDVPRGQQRELVRGRDRSHSLNASDSRMLSTIGAFRVVPERDLEEGCDGGRSTGRDLKRLRGEGLVQRVPLSGRDHAATLTQRGRHLLESHRRDHNPHRPQTFYAGADRPRERTHDSQLYRAYLETAHCLQERDARILRIELDRELKREYQRFLQDRNRDDPDSDGRPDRTESEIQRWADEHALPYFDEQVHFPDVRIEYEDGEGRIRYEDVEVTTEHYRGGHAAAAGRTGFTIVRGGSGGCGSRSFDPRVAEQFL